MGPAFPQSHGHWEVRQILVTHLFESSALPDFSGLGICTPVSANVTELIDVSLWGASFDRQSCTKYMAIYLLFLSGSSGQFAVDE